MKKKNNSCFFWQLFFAKSRPHIQTYKTVKMSFPSKLLLGFPDGHKVNYNLFHQPVKEGKLEILDRLGIRQIFN